MQAEVQGTSQRSEDRESGNKCDRARQPRKPADQWHPAAMSGMGLFAGVVDKTRPAGNVILLADDQSQREACRGRGHS